MYKLHAAVDAGSLETLATLIDEATKKDPDDPFAQIFDRVNPLNERDELDCVTPVHLGVCVVYCAAWVRVCGWGVGGRQAGWSGSGTQPFHLRTEHTPAHAHNVDARAQPSCGEAPMPCACSSKAAVT